MMYGWGGEFGGGPGIIGGILMMVFWVAIIVGVVMLIAWLTRQGAGGHTHYTGQVQGPHPGAGTEHRETAIDILNARYARGGIDKAEYEEKKKDLST
ncbi:MAG: SHOCT domain-containing protein [Thermoleophilia bacterium]